ncbi:MAG: aminotransferase class V-fold PLP-dependent enzyme [Clostridia bacterium]
MKVYFDNSATTQLDSQVFEAMKPYFCDNFGNADSLHSFGKVCSIAIDKARLSVAKAINAMPNEVYFTGSGSEANNWAIKGTMYARANKGKHIIISTIEHHSILNCVEWLAKNGFEASYAPVDEFGFVKVDELTKLIRPDTVLISIMYANNEVGSIQPIEQISALAHSKGILMHADCVQAMGSIPVDVHKLGVDLATISAHKFYGPKGVGALYIRNGLIIDKLIIGGGQERAQRGGTSNTPAIVGMGRAIEIATSTLQENAKYIASIRDYFVSLVQEKIPFIRFNGTANTAVRLPSNANFCFRYIEGDGLLTLLDFAGIAVSSGSACSSQSLLPSHVLLAMGVDIVDAHGSIRFSFGKHNTMQEVDYCVEVLAESVEKLRNISPLFKLSQGEKINV